MTLTRIVPIALIILLAVGCQSSDSENNGGWIDASLDGSSDTGLDWSACTTPSDCVLRANSCCGVCGQPELENMDAVNKNRTDAHFDDVCPEPGPCPDCVQERNPYLVPTCEQQTCVGYDVRQESFTECQSDADCRVRVRECCECGGTTAPSALIAIATDGETAYRDLICGGVVDCPECVPNYPDNAEAVCGESGHCEVEITP